MFGSSFNSGPYGGAMGSNPTMRLAGVLGHAQNPNFIPAQHAMQQPTPQANPQGGINPMFALGLLPGLISQHPLFAISPLAGALGMLFKK